MCSDPSVMKWLNTVKHFDGRELKTKINNSEDPMQLCIFDPDPKFFFDQHRWRIRLACFVMDMPDGTRKEGAGAWDSIWGGGQVKLRSPSGHCLSGSFVSAMEAIDCFTASLHSPNGRHLPAITAVQRTVSGLWKVVEIPTGDVSPHFHCYWGNPNLYLNQPITKGWCQPTGSHVS